MIGRMLAIRIRLSFREETAMFNLTEDRIFELLACGVDLMGYRGGRR